MALSRLLAEQRAKGFQPDGSLSVHRVLAQAAEALAIARAAPPELRFAKLNELHSRLLDVFRSEHHPTVVNSLSLEVRTRLFSWTKALNHLEEIQKEFPECAAEVVQPAAYGGRRPKSGP